MAEKSFRSAVIDLNQVKDYSLVDTSQVKDYSVIEDPNQVKYYRDTLLDTNQVKDYSIRDIAQQINSEPILVKDYSSEGLDKSYSKHPVLSSTNNKSYISPIVVSSAHDNTRSYSLTKAFATEPLKSYSADPRYGFQWNTAVTSKYRTLPVYRENSNLYPKVSLSNLMATFYTLNIKEIDLIKIIILSEIKVFNT